MIILLILANLIQASVTDNCGSDTCSMVIKRNGVEVAAKRLETKSNLLDIYSDKNISSAWGRPQEVRDICPTGYIPVDIDGNPVPIDDRTELSKVVVSLEYDIFDEDGVKTGTGNHDCDRYTFPADYTIELTDASQEKSIIDKEALGKNARSVSQRVLDLIAGHNLGLSLTTGQINQLKITYAAAKTYLDDGQPWGAKAEIATIAVDEPIITQELLDQVNIIFSESGLPGL